jgi:putative GTP pyrophosphokinase
MTNLEEARTRWILERPKYEKLGLEFARELGEEISREGIWAKLTSRPKEIDSLVRKLIWKPQYSYDTLLDKAGVRVVVRYKDEINLILEIADRSLHLSDVENAADRLDPNAVGYLSVHGAIRFRARDAKALEYPPDRFAAELQVRTLAQDLWAEMTHDSVYKNDETLQPLPNLIKRRVYILAGVIELADEEFNRIERSIPLVPEVTVLRALERHHYKLTARRADPEVSLEIIRTLSPLYGMESRQIVAHLAEFYASHESVLREVYGRAHGLSDRSAFLFQPEALMIYDLLELDQTAVRRAWNERFPEKELERIANAFGISFD